MNKTPQLLAAAMLAGLPAFALAQEPSPYFGMMGSYVSPDDARRLEDGAGAQLLFGFPLSDAWSTELTLFGHRANHTYDAGRDRGYGAGLDFRGTIGGSDARLAPFVLLGGGLVGAGDLVVGETAGYANLGVGLLWRLGGPRDAALRLEGRRMATFSDSISPTDDRLWDTRVNFGVEVALRAMPEPEPEPMQTAAPPPADSDRDGVTDDLDLCPGTPAGTRVDARGCAVPPAPVKDSDGDGVPDTADACADSPRGIKVDSRGCAVKAAVLVLRNVHFEFDSAKLTADAQAVLDGIVAGLRGQPSMEVRIEGHTDSMGSDAYNRKLSQRRAESVRSYLASQGISGARLRAEGHGESRPVADNSTDAGRAENRRVEFHVIKE